MFFFIVAELIAEICGYSYLLDVLFNLIGGRSSVGTNGVGEVCVLAILVAAPTRPANIQLEDYIRQTALTDNAINGRLSRSILRSLLRIADCLYEVAVAIAGAVNTYPVLAYVLGIVSIFALRRLYRVVRATRYAPTYLGPGGYLPSASSILPSIVVFAVGIFFGVAINIPEFVFLVYDANQGFYLGFYDELSVAVNSGNVINIILLGIFYVLGGPCCLFNFVLDLLFLVVFGAGVDVAVTAVGALVGRPETLVSRLYFRYVFPTLRYVVFRYVVRTLLLLVLYCGLVLYTAVLVVIYVGAAGSSTLAVCAGFIVLSACIPVVLLAVYCFSCRRGGGELFADD